MTPPGDLLAGGRADDVAPAAATSGPVAPTDLANAADLAAAPEALLLVAALALVTLAGCLAVPRPLTVAAAGTSAAATVALWTVDAVPAAGWFFLALAAIGVVVEVRGPPGIVVAGLGAGVALLFAGHAVRAVPDHLVVALLAAVTTAAATVRAGRTATGRGGTQPPPAAATLVGTVGVVLATEGHCGRAVVAGAVWPVRSPAGPLVAGSCVEVVAEAQGVLLVAPARNR